MRDDVNPHILRMFEGTFWLGAIHFMLVQNQLDGSQSLVFVSAIHLYIL